jgi:hypothetical protein
MDRPPSVHIIMGRSDNGNGVSSNEMLVVLALKGALQRANVYPIATYTKLSCSVLLMLLDMLVRNPIWCSNALGHADTKPRRHRFETSSSGGICKTYCNYTEFGRAG